MSTSVTVESQWHGQAVKIQGKRVVNKSAFEIGLIVEGQAKLLSPVLTGRLAGSYTTQALGRGSEIESPATLADRITPPSGDMEVLVGTAVGYGPYVEFGTVRQDAQPALRPALDLAKGQMLTVIYRNGRYEFAEYIR